MKNILTLSSSIPAEKRLIDMLENDLLAFIDEIGNVAAARMEKIDGIAMNRCPHKLEVNDETTHAMRVRDIVPYLTPNERDEYMRCEGILSLSSNIMLRKKMRSK